MEPVSRNSDDEFRRRSAMSGRSGSGRSRTGNECDSALGAPSVAASETLRHSAIDQVPVDHELVATGKQDFCRTTLSPAASA